MGVAVKFKLIIGWFCLFFLIINQPGPHVTRRKSQPPSFIVQTLLLLFLSINREQSSFSLSNPV